MCQLKVLPDKQGVTLEQDYNGVCVCVFIQKRQSQTEKDIEWNIGEM